MFHVAQWRTISLVAALLVTLTNALPAGAAAMPYPDRFVWIFGWSLRKDSDVANISQVLDTAGRHGVNGAVVSLGLDSLCKKSPEDFRRLDELKQACERNKIDLIPALFSVGYGGPLDHNPNLAEGFPVQDAVFRVSGREARFVPEASALLINGGFEEFQGNKLKSFSLQDQPGEVSLVDTNIKHGGRVSLRLENFTANPSGHGRVMQELQVRSNRCYRMSLWVKTEGLEPEKTFQISVLARSRMLVPCALQAPVHRRLGEADGGF